MSGREIHILDNGRVIQVDDGAEFREVASGRHEIEILSIGQAVFNLAGSSAHLHTQSTAYASWVIAHGLGRVPGVSIYLMSGEEIETDVFADASTVNIVFPAATAGRALLR